jgi:general secretion pathway protein E
MIQACKLPYNFARKYSVCIVGKESGIHLFSARKINAEILAEVRRFCGPIDYVEKVTADMFNNTLARIYQHEAGLAQRVADDVGETLSLEQYAESAQADDLLAQEDDAPVVRLINALLLEALRENASDIHIETYEKQMSVRLRVDGIMQEALSLQPRLAPMLVSRIKVMANIDISEKRLPQDGRISIRLGNREIDVRVSTLPAGASERVVLRILDKQAGRLTLEQMGFSEAAVYTLTKIIGRQHGIVLVTGPTGSGKTTTLYAMLSKLNDRSRNILTIEDPVEYQMQGIGQSQVNTKIDLTFAVGLRAILRQDPDVVMVGEIRDMETARIAVQASLTGHLVLSTLHTNSAIGSITRLIDMGVEPFLLASSLVGVVAQRLVRRLCDDCKETYIADETECRFLGISPEAPPLLCRPKGCPSCRGTGYKGRLAIAEIVVVDAGLQKLIHDNSSEQDMVAYARNYSSSILDDGRSKIMQNITSCEEIMRIIND